MELEELLAELEAFFALVDADPRFTTCLVPVGRGEYVAVKSLV